MPDIDSYIFVSTKTQKERSIDLYFKYVWMSYTTIVLIYRLAIRSSLFILALYVTILILTDQLWKRLISSTKFIICVAKINRNSNRCNSETT